MTHKEVLGVGLGRWAGIVLLVFALASGAQATEDPSSEEAAIRKVISDYGRAIETKDLSLFRELKPNLTKEEEERVRRAFATVASQTVTISVRSLEVREKEATVRVSRRDVLSRTAVASFPQTFLLEKGHQGWSIREIGK